MSDENPGSEKDDPNSQAAEALKACVIAAYEQALRDGLTPCEALAVMLDWASEEWGRVCVV